MGAGPLPRIPGAAVRSTRYTSSFRSGLELVQLPKVVKAAKVFQDATSSREDYSRRTWELLYRDLKVMATDSTISTTGLQAVIDLMAENGSFSAHARMLINLEQQALYNATNFGLSLKSDPTGFAKGGTQAEASGLDEAIAELLDNPPEDWPGDDRPEGTSGDDRPEGTSGDEPPEGGR